MSDKKSSATSAKFFNERTQSIKPYVLSKRFDLTESDKAVPLDWNESLFGPSDRVRRDVIDYISKASFNIYPDGDSPELLNELTGYTGAESEQILTFNGSDSALHDCIFSLLSNNDKVLVVEPEYNQVDIFIHMAGAVKVSYFADDIFNLDIKDLSSFITRNECKVVYLSNPSNPVGRCLDEFFIRGILDTGVFLLLDEAYVQYTDGDCLGLINEYSNLIIFRTFSKAMALAGLRLGYICSNRENILMVKKIRNPKEINQISQIAAISVLRHRDDLLDQIKEMKLVKRNFIENVNGFDKNILVRDTHTNFVLITCTRIQEIISALQSQGIIVRDRSSMYQLQNTARITIGRSEQMNRVAATIFGIVSK
jgi:histidinol-phosphate aminotransferase